LTNRSLVILVISEGLGIHMQRPRPQFFVEPRGWTRRVRQAESEDRREKDDQRSGWIANGQGGQRTVKQTEEGDADPDAKEEAWLRAVLDLLLSKGAEKVKEAEEAR
jgi:hypothetical protein